jgi:hypothetical protein
MRSEREQFDCFCPFMLNQLEDDSEIMLDTARAVAVQVALKFVAFQLWVEHIFRKQLKGGAERFRD